MLRCSSLALLLALSSALPSSAQSVTLSASDYGRLMSLLSELSLINAELEKSIGLSYENITALSNEIEAISSELSSLRADYQASLQVQEQYSIRFNEAEALLQQAEESLKRLTLFYEARLLQEQRSKRQWQLGLGAANVIQFILVLTLLGRALNIGR